MSVKGEFAVADLVLIVDDDEAVRTTLYKVIRSNGLDAEMASGGEQALELISKTHYDSAQLAYHNGYAQL